MSKLAYAAIGILSSVASAQPGLPPIERQVFPMPGFSQPLFAGEVDVATDLEAALLTGPIESVTVKMYLVDESFQKREFAGSILRTEYDECGNIALMELGSQWDGVEEIQMSIPVATEYSEGDCRRTSLRIQAEGGDVGRLGGASIYNEQKELVSIDYGETSFTIHRLGGVVLSAELFIKEYGETQTFRFEPNRGRLIEKTEGTRVQPNEGGLNEIEEAPTVTKVHWASGRELTLTQETDGGDQVIELELDEHGSISMVTIPGGGMFGHQIQYRYEYDGRDNWVARVMRIVQKAGDEPVNYMYYTRAIVYRDAAEPED